MRRCSILTICIFLFVASIALASPNTPADTGFGNDVLTMANFGGDLIVGGKFFTAGGVITARIGGWDGSSWYEMSGLPLGPEVYSLHEFNGELYAGTFAPTLYKWANPGWSSVGPDLAPQLDYGKIYAMETFNNELYVGGGFKFDTLYPARIAKWNGTDWDSLGLGVTGGGSNVYAMAVYDGALIVAGSFTMAGGDSAASIARWDGANWTKLGSGLTSDESVTTVTALAVYAGDLIATGDFTKAGGNSATRIAKWNGTIWQPLAQGLNGVNAIGRALTVFGDSLVVGGTFTTAGATPVNNIALWNSSWTWAPIGNGLDSFVYSLGVYNSELIAGGAFSEGGGHIAKWDSTNWVPLSGIVTSVDEGKTTVLPSRIRLDQNYPNPFNPSTTIKYSVTEISSIRVEILNMLGQKIRTLVDTEQSAGNYETSWDGQNEQGSKVASGLYFYRLSTDNFQQSKKMLLLK